MRFIQFVFSRFFICITVIAALVAAIIILCFYIHSLLPAAAALALAYTLSVAAALCLLFGESPPDFKCAWLILIVALPVAGSILYFISYLSRTHKKQPAPLPARSYCSSYEYFRDGANFLARLTALISAARKNIYLEFYIISKGHIWGAINRELTAALKRGVEVKIIYDGLGSATRAPKKDFKALTKAGAEIKIFNKLMPLPVARLNFRDHRKIAVIDDEAVFLGGVNIADEYANLSSPHGYWKDGGAVFFGAIAKAYSRIFLCAFNGNYGDCPQHMCGSTDKLELQPVIDEPERRGGACEDLLASALYSAEKRIYIFTPYLCMGDKLCDALTFAVKRGVDVKMIIPHIPDKKLTYAITRTYCETLSADGVKIYTYTPGFMHFKAVVCDDRALLGSYNFDFRSMRLNYECGVFGGAKLADDISLDFEECLTISEPYKPKNRRGVGTRLARTVLYLLAPLV